MPELPEVEDAARRLRAAVLNRTIVSARALHPSTARSLTDDACRRLVGQRVVSVDRRAKLQVVRFADDRVLEVHLRMTGDWDIGRDNDPPPQYERARFTCDDGTRISFVDSRAFGVLTVHNPGTFILPAYGPEPLNDAFTATVLMTALHTRRGPIKPVLLDQQVIAGLGNIYAAEALWEARIRPDTPANRIALLRVARLRDAIRLVLNQAPSTRYYERAERVEESWRVYDREGEPCLRCGKTIMRIVQAGRSTFYCRRCQR